MTSHIFNERMSRFEPVEQPCAYCNQSDQFIDKKSIYYVPLYKEHDRTNIVVYRSVKYQRVTVGVPRCSGCLRIHTSERRKGYLYAFILFVVIVALAVQVLGMLGIMIATLGGALIAGFAADKLGPYLASRRGILSPQAGAEATSLIQHLVDLKGWSFDKPRA
jgi:hypothetical protein